MKKGIISDDLPIEFKIVREENIKKIRSGPYESCEVISWNQIKGFTIYID